jgi:hypothetical protein
MARSRTTKPKTAEPTEFNYEDDDAVYNQIMTSAVTQYPTVVYDNPSEGVTMSVGQGIAAPLNLIYLVEGKVRLDQEGSGPIFSDQRRIVNATNVDEAIQKFVNYFAGMSSPVQRYTVVTVAGSETIL